MPPTTPPTRGEFNALVKRVERLKAKHKKDLDALEKRLTKKFEQETRKLAAQIGRVEGEISTFNSYKGYVRLLSTLFAKLENVYGQIVGADGGHPDHGARKRANKDMLTTLRKLVPTLPT